MKKIPKHTTEDIVHKAIKGAVSVFGTGLAAEFYEMIWKPPFEKRMLEWAKSINQDLKKLQKKDKELNFKNLNKNEIFNTTLFQATHMAIRSHQKEKLDALRAAVLNSASSGPPEENLKLMFLSFVDTFNPWHLKILEFLDSPERWLKKFPFQYTDIDVTSPMHIFYQAFPHMRDQRHFINQLIEDLSLKGLLSKKGIQKQMRKPAYLRTSHTSYLGKLFLQFITSPIEDE